MAPPSDSRKNFDFILSNFPRPRATISKDITIGDVKPLFAVQDRALEQNVAIKSNFFINVIFSGVVQNSRNDVKDWRISLWLSTKVKGTVNIQAGPRRAIELGFFLTQKYGLPFAYILSDQAKFRRLRFRLFESTSYVNEDKEVLFENLKLKENIMFPLTLRGLHVSRSPNPDSLDFDLYLKDLQGDRYNRFVLVGTGIVSETECYDDMGVLSSDFVRIRDLFMESIGLVPDTGSGYGSTAPAVQTRCWDFLDNDTKLSIVTAAALGGFRRPAGSNLKDSLGVNQAGSGSGGSSTAPGAPSAP